MEMVPSRGHRPLDKLMFLLLLLEDLLGFCAGTHTLRYDLMVSRDGSGEPQFLAWGYLDDKIFLHYDGASPRDEPQEIRIKGLLGAETWAREMEDLQVKERQLRRMLAEVMEQKDQDTGFHILQATLGCSFQGNGTEGFWNLGYDRQDLLTFDLKALTWTVAMPSAQPSKRIWEVHGPRADLIKTFLYDTCPAQLKGQLSSLKDHMMDTDPPPVVTVTHHRNRLHRINLMCRAVNLHNNTATLTWLQDEESTKQPTYGPHAILPSGGGTYQTWVSTWVLPGEESRFTCHLEHGSQDTSVPVVPGKELGIPCSITGLQTEARKAHGYKQHPFHPGLHSIKPTDLLLSPVLPVLCYSSVLVCG